MKKIFNDTSSTRGGVIDTGGAPWHANISANFRKFETILGLGEDDSWNQTEAKISWHCPFKIRNNIAEQYGS